MDRTPVLLQMIGMVVFYLLLLIITFQAYKRITHKRLSGNLATVVALFCLATSLVCTVALSYAQKGG